MGNVVLLGDSIFDNGVYVSPEPDVRHQLQARLGGAWDVTLLAVDGHVTADVTRWQLQHLPEDASHLVISVGGNDALRHSSVFGERIHSVAEGVERLAQAQSHFAAAYSEMIGKVLQARLPTAVCTIYDANYPEPQRRLVVTGLALFNDVITRVAFSNGLPLIDLRLICSEPADYANPIEPSYRGGDKIAAAIARMIGASARASLSSSVWI